MLEQTRVFIVVIRHAMLDAVLDVGLNIVAMDFPEARWLDLTLALADDGLSAELRDRAPEGTTLAESVKECEQRAPYLNAPIGYPATLHGCHNALATLKRAAEDESFAEARPARLFAQRSCDARGRYIWARGRFGRAQ